MEREDGKGRDPSGAIGRNIEPFLLFELLRAPSYGYDLIRRLGQYGFRRATEEPGVVYKVLRALEDNGSIQSEWATQESGPARRYYEITESGRAVLLRHTRHLSRYIDRVAQLLEAYVAITGNDLATDPALEPAPIRRTRRATSPATSWPTGPQQEPIATVTR